MKRRLVGAGGVVLMIALVAIFGWYIVYTRASTSALNEALATYESRKPVNVTFNISVPESTPKDQVLYLSGSVPALGNWDAAGVALNRGDDGKYHAQIPELLHGMEYAFKVTRGTWGTVETDKENKDIPNHTFTAAKDASVDATVAEWRDGGKAVPGRVTMTGSIQLVKKWHSSALNNDRNLIVFLPPGYDKNASQRYPVLYLQDGQNLMDEATSYQGIEWGIDEAAQRLMSAGQIEPAIIVGIYNAGEFRGNEFTPPFAGADKAKAQGDAYARMVVEEVKPFVDSHFRTKPDRASTIIGGGSMGGLIALYTAKTHPDTFGQVIALSPWLRLSDKPIVPELVGDGAWVKKSKFYIDMGTEPGHNYAGGSANALPDAQQLIEQLEKAGLKNGAEFTYREIEGGKQNEASWAQTIDQVLIAVLAKPADATTKPN